MVGIIVNSILISICAVVFIVIILAATCCRKCIGHDILGWHDCDVEGCDGASLVGTCKYCGQKCMMDSQGNWF